MHIRGGDWIIQPTFYQCVVSAISGKVFLMASDTICSHCNVEMEQIERTTFSGRDMREYQCPQCKHKEIVDCGDALWKILADASRPKTDK